MSRQPASPPQVRTAPAPQQLAPAPAHGSRGAGARLRVRLGCGPARPRSVGRPEDRATEPLGHPARAAGGARAPSRHPRRCSPCSGCWRGSRWRAPRTGRSPRSSCAATSVGRAAATSPWRSRPARGTSCSGWSGPRPRSCCRSSSGSARCSRAPWCSRPSAAPTCAPTTCCRWSSPASSPGSPRGGARAAPACAAAAAASCAGSPPVRRPGRWRPASCSSSPRSCSRRP